VANNETKIILTAEDKTSGVLAAATRNLQSMSGAATLASSALAAIGVSFSGAAAVALIKGTIDAADGFNDLSQRVGIGIKELAGWTLAANQSGTSMESVARGIKSLSTYMVDHADKLKAAGITATDVNGAMLQLADMFKAMPDGVEKTALSVQLLGKAGMDMIPVFNMGSAELQKAQEKAAAYGKKMAELAPDADKFNDQMEEFGLHAKAAGMNIANIFIPGLIGLSQWLNDVAAGGAKARQALGWISGGLLDDEGGATGYSGPLDKFGLPAKPGTGKAAPATNPRALLDKSAAAGGAGQSPLARMLAEQKKRIAAINATYGDEQTVSVDSVSRQYEQKELDALEKKRIAMEEMAEERMEQQRIESEGEEAIRLAMEKTTREMKSQDDAARQLGLSFTSAFEDAVIGGKKASEVVRGLGMDIARIFLRKNVTEPMANSMSGLFSGGIGKLFEGFFGGGGGGAASQGFGMAGDAGALLGFAGGGYTGDGARSGGLDGQGGFLAMLHPRETVTDHATGGGGGGVTVNLSIGVGVAQTVRAEIANLLPSISASVQGAVMDARLRGGSTRAAYRG
jgi:hypothetical protein